MLYHLAALKPAQKVSMSSWSAITAHDAGAQVLVVEKMPNPGGISICSGGCIWGHLYISGSNLTERFVGGCVAGREAAALTATPTASRSAQ